MTLWVGTWSQTLSDHSYLRLGAEHRTLRAVVRISLGGSRVRVRFSNRFGSRPLKIDAASLALAGQGMEVRSHSLQKLSFAGQSGLLLQEGQDAISDPLVLPVPDLARLAVSMYLEQSAFFDTANVGQGEMYGSIPGNHGMAGKKPFSPFSSVAEEYPLPFIGGIDVLSPDHARAVVAFGDSITAMGWPAMLAERLNALGMTHIGVLNQGVGGNRVLHANTDPILKAYGPSGVSRFQKDVLEQSGVRHVLVLHGTNDIGHPGVVAPADEAVTAQEILAGLEECAGRAHSAGISIFVGTLLPFEGFRDWSPELEDKRQELNALIRNSKAFDALWDLDAALRDPSAPTRLLPVYDSGDNLHPGAQGLRAIAESVDVNWFK
jgi:lysophospholipase L1-like esterase